MEAKRIRKFIFITLIGIMAAAIVSVLVVFFAFLLRVKQEHENDLAKIAGDVGVAMQKIDCKPTFISRFIVCTFEIDRESYDQLTKNLEFEKYDENKMYGQFRMEDYCNVIKRHRKGDDWQIAEWEPSKKGAIPTGYTIPMGYPTASLVYNPDSGEACILMIIGYG